MTRPPRWPFYDEWTVYDHVTFGLYTLAMIGLGWLIGDCK